MFSQSNRILVKGYLLRILRHLYSANRLLFIFRKVSGLKAHLLWAAFARTIQMEINVDWLISIQGVRGVRVLIVWASPESTLWVEEQFVSG